ncbi:MAG: dipeptidase [Leptospiraceae bacterium]|nr:dipeptidase [Leptospiraceae bacterium]
MIRKILITLGVLLLISAGFFCLALGSIVDGKRNAVYPHDTAQASVPSEEAQALHQTLFVADLHADSLCWDRDLLEENDRGHLDLPRMQKGNVALQVWTVFSKIPRGLNVNSNPSDSDLMPLMAISARWPLSAWFSPKGRALHLARRAHSLADKSDGQLQIIRSKGDLTSLIEARKGGEKKVGILLGLEGAHALEDGVGDIDAMYDAGYRVIGLVHFFDNRYGGSSSGEAKGGLTDEGKELIRQMEGRGMVVDLAHASPRLFADTMAISTKPLIISHTGLQSLCDSPRNITDQQLREVADRGGIVGIGYWEGATCGQDIESIVKSIAYAVKLVGANHVALGSDFDGSTTTPLDGTELSLITAGLLNSGMSPDQVRLVMGENFQKLALAALH